MTLVIIKAKNKSRESTFYNKNIQVILCFKKTRPSLAT